MCIELVPVFYENKFSQLTGTNSMRTSAMCYTFQKEKKTPNLLE